ncbi:transposase domain-containing protein [Bradyrhizobium sp.]|uniref:transposase domain-containing protein n=1 Tax=Bradyrhizobium sp. TaxID=376 RepID=UPI0025C0FF3D|nr:transposase domain-containing protein [Bradyrhizobium sp.]
MTSGQEIKLNKLLDHCDLFVRRPSDGGADRWATVCSLITSAKLNDVEPLAYLQHVLERMSGGHPMSELDQLLPWNWRPKTLN